jgi:hypothetical protein
LVLTRPDHQAEGREREQRERETERMLDLVHGSIVRRAPEAELSVL